jgi:hypothetical protein
MTDTCHPGARARQADRSINPGGRHKGRGGWPSHGILGFEVSVITKELLKAEIDKVPEENLGVLYRIVKALEEPQEENDRGAQAADAAAWKAWIAETYGSTADAPIERGEQGSYEVREPFE